jgi:GNAT superfamily N-acetyltransferase
MKGLKIVRATGQNSIDIYPLLQKAAEEKALLSNPSPKQLKDFYFGGLLRQLGAHFQLHYWFLARRGRGYLGVLHAQIMPGLWDGSIDTMVVTLVYVTKSRRKLGVGRKLIDALLKEAENLGIKHIQFLCPEDLTEYWVKERGAQKLANLMRVSL